MNRNDVQTLLGAAAAIDPTVPAPARQVLDMWAAMLDDVPAEAGQRAVRDYYRSDAYRESKRTIAPADIVGHWRAARQDEGDRKVVREIAQQRAAIESAPAPVRSLSERFAAEMALKRGDDPDEAEAEAAAHRQMMRVACPHCRARPGQRCTTPQGRQLTRQPAHDSRLDAVRGKQLT